MIIAKTPEVNNNINILALTHNAISITSKFIDLLYKNTKDFNLVIVDNGSEDSTPNYLRDFSSVRDNIAVALSSVNLGVIDGRNLAYDIGQQFNSDSEYVVILDNDQFVRPGWLEDHISYLQEGNYDAIGVEAWQMRHDFYPFHRNSSPNEPYHYIGCGGSLIKNEVIKKIGLFDTRFNPSYFEDPDFTFRCIDAGYKIGWNYKAKIDHWAGGHQTLGSCQYKNQRFLDSFMKFRQKWQGRKLTNILTMKR